MVSVALVGLLLLGVACGPTSAPPEPTVAPSAVAVKATEPASTQPAPTEPPTAQPEPTQAATEEEQVFVWADSSTWADIDPRGSYSDEPRILSSVYETLVVYNPPGSAERLSPGLATSWEANADATEWTFHLRPGVLFHDGTPFGAEAVKASIESTSKLGLGAAWEWSAVESIEVVDDLTVKFKLSYAVPST